MNVKKAYHINTDVSNDLLFEMLFLHAHGLASVRPNTCRLRRYHFLTTESSFQIGSLNLFRVSTTEGLCFRKREYSIDEYFDLSPVVRGVVGGGWVPP